MSLKYEPSASSYIVRALHSASTCPVMVWALGFRVLGLGVGGGGWRHAFGTAQAPVRELGFGVQCSWFGDQGFECLGFRVSGSGIRV